nr:cytochrome c biogenesis protein CcdA [bacterium]
MQKHWSLIFALILMIPFTLFAQDIPGIGLKPVLTHSEVPAGQSFSLLAQIEIPGDHHLTENFLELRLSDIEGFESGFQQVSSGEFEKGEVVRRGTAMIKLPVDISADLQPGDYTVKGALTYQLCRDIQPQTCYPPADKEFSMSLTVVPASATAVDIPEGIALAAAFDASPAAGAESGGVAGSGETLENRLTRALAQGSILAYIIVFIAGFLTSLTPCVYPMIPITISYIGGRSTGKGKFRGFFLSLFYVLGLALVYAILGVVAALTGSLFGSITQTPAVIGGVALLFGIMGLSVLGLFDIQLPSSLQGRLQGGGPRSGFLGAIVMGAVAGLVAAPCAGPVVVALMTFIASTGAVFFGFTLMLAFAAGLGILFIVLGTFSGLLSALPSAGMWMDKVKKAFGVIMIGAALYIAKPV